MKDSLKTTVDRIFKVMTFPLYALYGMQQHILGERKAMSGVTQLCSMFPGTTGEWFRRGLLQWITGDTLHDACISFGTLFSDPRVRLGNGIYIGTRCDIGYALIGSDCVIGSGVHILSGQQQHIFDDPNIPIRDQGGTFRKISIGSDTWIGNGVIVAADVGSGCVIGAGSVVVKPIPDRSVAAGNPARVLRSR